ncbi:unnamed protein product [Musa hybrid cultivar]
MAAVRFPHSRSSSYFTSSISIDVGIFFAALGGIAGRQLHHSSNFLSLPHLFSPLVRTNGNRAYVIDTLALGRRTYYLMLEAQQVPSKQAEAITSVITIVWRMLPSPSLRSRRCRRFGVPTQLPPTRASYEKRAILTKPMTEGRSHKWMIRNCACH